MALLNVTENDKRIYEELLAFKRVAEKLNLSRQDIEDIMYNNAMELIEGARRDIYGK